MDLTSAGTWSVRDGPVATYPTLAENLKCDALVVGSGISGALALHRLATKGVECVPVDWCDIGYGSTSASTALLQYEIDTRCVSSKSMLA